VSLGVTLKDALVKRRGKTLLGPISLDLGGQGITMVLGPNGAGKTTLLKVMHGVATRLSGGEKQKLALGRALIRQPRLLFLDEPCANLDGRSTREIEALLRDANAAGTRIVMTTHDLGQAKRLAGDALFLLNGKLHEQGAAAKFFDAPQRSETKAFLEGDIVE